VATGAGRAVGGTTSATRADAAVGTRSAALATPFFITYMATTERVGSRCRRP